MEFQSSLPRGERRDLDYQHDILKTISILAPTRGATQSILNSLKTSLFQSSLPRGERLAGITPDGTQGTFQSSLPRGERLLVGQQTQHIRQFQSSLPRGERRSRSVYSLCHYAISILAPTRGATLARSTSVSPILISILAPTRGATSAGINLDRGRSISILAPTRGAT